MKLRCIVGIFACVTACSSSRGDIPTELLPDCTAEARPGIILTTFDSLSGQQLSAPAVVVAQDGVYSERGLAGPPQYLLAIERRGTYIVTVDLPGYQQWRKGSVVVESDRCHVITVRLSALLVR